MNALACRLSRKVLTFSLLCSSLLWVASSANAVPSMARQTGYACSRCHTVFPELTAFGRQFKLGAYTMSSDKWDARTLIERLPVAAALQISQTNTSNTAAGGAMPQDFSNDRELILQTLRFITVGKLPSIPVR